MYFAAGSFRKTSAIILKARSSAFLNRRHALPISYRDLLEVFFVIHDPTTLNRQGNDMGTQYRSAVYFHTPEQEATAREVMKEVAHAFDDPIVTEIAAAETFWPAEDYHQNYFRNNPHQGYCMFVVSPKVEKFRKQFASLRA